MQPIAECFDADEHERAHRGHVQRTAERGADADESFEIAIVVLRQIDAGCRIEVDRRIVEQRCVRQIAAFEREAVQERLQRRTGLPVRAYAVDVPGARCGTGGADIGEHVARCVVDDERRAVADVVLRETFEVIRHHVARHRLNVGIERRHQTLPGTFEHRTREVGGEARRIGQVCGAIEHAACGRLRFLRRSTGSRWRRRARVRTRVR